MKALVCTQPGELSLHDFQLPEPRTGHAIVKIRRIGVCGTDLHAFEGTQPFFTYPRILGHELAGDLIEADQAPGFVPGEPVTIIPYFNCGTCLACKTGKPNCCAQLRVFGVHTDGGMCTYVSVPSYSLVHADGLDYDALALVEPLAIGAHGVWRAGIRRDEFVLVVGAGPIGLGTMENALLTGCTLIAMDSNKSRLQFCRDALHIQHAIDASSENIMEHLLDITGGDMPSVVIDATGNRAAINGSLRYLAHGGRYVLIGLQKETIAFSHPEFHKRETTLMSSRNATRLDFEQVMLAMKKGLINPLHYITHRTTLADTAAAFPSWLDPSSGVIKAMIHVD